jgi:hypothetical protein
MHTDTVFSTGYATARAKFLAACTLRGLTPQTHAHPLAGAQREQLSTEVVRVGPADAGRVLVLTSGVHGVELFAGSGCQIDWLLAHPADALPPDTAVVLVHAINPWGASWLRRYTEDNVDLCRNFIDHSAPPPSSAYGPLHAAIDLDPREADSVARGDAVLAAFAEAKGHDALYNALMAGQYTLPHGMGFGGQAPTWSRKTIEAVLRQHCAMATDVCLVDYHTGLGPYGYGSIVALQQGAQLQRMREAFGPWVVAVHEDGAPEDFAPVTGAHHAGLRARAAAGARDGRGAGVRHGAPAAHARVAGARPARMGLGAGPRPVVGRAARAARILLPRRRGLAAQPGGPVAPGHRARAALSFAGMTRLP